MSTTVKTARAWVPATVTTVLAVVLVVGSGLLWEILRDQDVAALGDADSLLGSFVYGQLPPLGGPGIVGDADFADAIVPMLAGLVPVAVVVFLFTWLAGRSGSFGTLLGAWLGTALGVGLGALVRFEVFARQNDLTDEFFGIQQARVESVELGLYWGAAAGLLLGLLAMLTWAVSRRRVDVDDGTSYAPGPDPADTGEHVRPADPAPAAPATATAPPASDRPAPPPGPFEPPDKTVVRPDHTP